MELKNKQTVHIVGGNKTAYNLFNQLLKNGISAKAYVFEGEYMNKKNPEFSFNKDWSSCADLPESDHVIVSSETAFNKLSAKDKTYFKNHYYLRDKLNLGDISQKIGVRSLKDLNPSQDVSSFPIIAKPKESGANEVPFKFKVINNMEVLESILKIKNKCIFQRYLDPKNYKQIAIAGYFTGHSQSLIAVEQLNQYPVGISALIKYRENSESRLIEAITNFLNEIDYRGFIEFEFKVSKENGDKFIIDINPRTWGWSDFYIEGVKNLPAVIFENEMPELILKEYWVNLPRLVLANTKGRFINPNIMKFLKNKIAYEPYFP